MRYSSCDRINSAVCLIYCELLMLLNVLDDPFVTLEPTFFIVAEVLAFELLMVVFVVLLCLNILPFSSRLPSSGILT